MALETKLWDSAEFIENEEDLAEYLAAVIEDSERPRMYGHALELAGRVRGSVAVVSFETLVSTVELQKAIEKNDESSLPVLLRVQQAYARIASSGRHAA